MLSRASKFSFFFNTQNRCVKMFSIYVLCILSCDHEIFVEEFLFNHEYLDEDFKL